MKRKYFVACVAAAAVLAAGCGDSKKEADSTDTTAAESTDESTQEESTDDLEEDVEGDTEGEDATDDDGSTDEEITDDEDAEDDADVDSSDLAETVPADYLVEDADQYVTLGDCEGLEATEYNYEITDDMVQEEIDTELEEAATEESTDAASVEGNTVYFTMTYKVSGSDDEEESEDTYVTIGQEDYGAEFDEKLTGVSTGDELEFSITFDDEIWIEDWVDQTVDFTVSVSDVVESIVPEYNLDYVTENTDYTTIEEYEQSVRDSLEENYESQSYYDVTEALIDAGMEASTFDGYPQELYDECEEEFLSMYSMFVGDDATIDDVLEMFGFTEDDVKEETEKLVNRRLFVSAYCKANDLTADGETYKNYVTEYAESYGEDAETFEEYYTRAYLVRDMFESMVKDSLYQSANLTKTTVSGDAGDDTETDEVLEEDADTDADAVLDEEDMDAVYEEDADTTADEEA